MRILIATPAFNGNITAAYLNSFIHTTSLLNSKGHSASWITNHRDGLISIARNACAGVAVEQKFDQIIFIDSDIVWAPKQVLELVESKRAIVGGTYPYKSYPIELIYNPLPGKKKEFKGNDWEFEVEHLPTGFLKIDVSVFGVIAPFVKSYERRGKPGEQKRIEKDYFRVGVNNGYYETEDYGFCNIAREAGLKIYLNQNCVVAHMGNHTYIWDNQV